MSDINKSGVLENKLAVYSWRWNETARNLDARDGTQGTTEHIFLWVLSPRR